MTKEMHKVATVDELDEEGSRVLVEIEGREIGIFNIDNTYHAILNYCPHASGPLCEGPTKGRFETDLETGRLTYQEESQYLQCPWHDWKFDVKTGRNVHSDKYAAPTYETIVRDGYIYVQV